MLVIMAKSIRYEFCIIIMLLFTSLAATAQDTWQQVLAEMMTAEDSEQAHWEDTYERLSELAANPLDLNTATRDQLAELPFLSQQQVEDLCDYIYHYGPMKSMGELRMITTLGYDQLRLLPFFVRIAEEPVSPAPTLPSLAELMRYGRHELLTTGRIPLYERRGDKNGYLGYPYRHWLRYTFSHGTQLKAGLVAAQDAGEPLFAGQNRWGYDYYSPYLQLRQLGRVETFVAGRYKLQLGMGLIAGSAFALGKLATLQQMGRSANMLRAHSSRSASGYFQGAAATVRLTRQFSLLAMGSFRSLDATLAKDGSATTLLTNGYHRTPLEMSKKNNTHSTDGGLSLRFNHQRLHLGLNAVATHLNRPLQPATALYRRYYPHGTDFLNASLDYSYASRRLCLNGETATDRHGALATLNSLSFRFDGGLSLMLLQRFYSYRYTALYANSLSEGSRVQNESAFYLGADWQPSPSLRLQAYADYSRAPWARYGISRPSWASDNLLQLTYSHRQWRLQGRYRLHIHQHDHSSTDDDDNSHASNGSKGAAALDQLTDQRTRLAFTYTIPGGHLSFTTQADAVAAGVRSRDFGWMVSQQGSCQWHWLRLNALCAYFHTDGYDSRLYLYERSPLYTFSFPSLYGQGIRYSLMGRATLNRQFALTLKLGVTDYFDRATTGTGLQLVNGSSLADLDLQLRVII